MQSVTVTSIPNGLDGKSEPDAAGHLVFASHPGRSGSGVGDTLTRDEKVVSCAWAAPINPNRTSRAIVNSVLVLLIFFSFLRFKVNGRGFNSKTP